MIAIAIGSASRHFVRCLLATHMGSGVATEPHRRVRYAVFVFFVVCGTDAFACHSVRVLPVCAMQDCRLQGCSPRMASLQFQMQGSAISSFTAEPYCVSRRDGGHQFGPLGPRSCADPCKCKYSVDMRCESPPWTYRGE